MAEGIIIVCDITALSIKLGFSGKLAPEVVIPIQYPLNTSGEVLNSELFENLMEYSLKKLGVDLPKCKICITRSPEMKRRDTLALLNLFLNRFSIQAVGIFEEAISNAWKTANNQASEQNPHLDFEGASLFADLVDDPTFWIHRNEYFSQGGKVRKEFGKLSSQLS